VKTIAAVVVVAVMVLASPAWAVSRGDPNDSDMEQYDPEARQHHLRPPCGLVVQI
jgi:hypothetical protein